MMYHWKKYWETILFSALIVLASTILFVVELPNQVHLEKVYLAVIAAIITLYIGLLRVKVEQDKFEQSLFEHFNGRYNSKLDDLLNKVSHDNNESSGPNELDKEDKKIIINYLNLCAEEFYWYKRGRIPRSIWDAWIAGIKQKVKYNVVKRVIKEEMEKNETKKSYYDFLDHLIKKHKL